MGGADPLHYVAAGPDVEDQAEGTGDSDGGFLLCVSELDVTKPVKKKDKEVTLGLMVLICVAMQ